MTSVSGDRGRQRSWELSFAADHPLSLLRARWTGEAPRPLRLDLLAGLPEGCPPPAADPGLELQRADLLLTHAARLRLEQAAAPGARLEAGSLVLVSSDKMTAWLFLLPPVGGGAELATPQLHQALLHGGVRRGIDWGLLRRIPGLEPRYFVPFAVARGVPALAGRDGAVIDRIPRGWEEQTPPEGLTDAGCAVQALLRRIGEGDILCEIVPPGPGRPGHTVTGEALPAPDGQAAPVPSGRNTRLSPDGRFLVAGCDGHVSFSGRGFQVKPVLHLYEQDLDACPVVKFLGDVHIHCDLPAGAAVSATGSIQIDGAVENCSIEAGEHLIMSSGAQGQGQAVLRAHKRLYAKYLESCTVFVRQDLFADCVIHCDVHCDGAVQVCSGRGVLIGGTVRAAQGIRAGVVGSKAERATSLVLGGRPCEEAEAAQLTAELEEIARQLGREEQADAGPAREPRLAKLRLHRCIAQAKLDKLHGELKPAAPARGRAENTPRAECGTVYPGVRVAIGSEAFLVEQPRQNCVIGLAGTGMGYL